MAWTSATSATSALLLVGVLCVAAFLAPVSAQPADAMDSPSAPAHPAAKEAVAKDAAPSSQDVNAFFPSIKGDLTKVTWAHAVNSLDLLDKALNDSVMMLEADVIMGRTPSSSADEPVMGHPPATTSDLSLTTFLRSVTTYNQDHAATRRGIKLDFKTIDVFEKALDHLKSTFGTVPAFPVWLNADVLPGPVNATEAQPVDVTRFLAKAKADYPDLMLSLGWTTRWGKGLNGADQSKVPVEQVKYSQEDVKAMIAALTANSVTQPITYAVRAAFVANSLAELKSLLDQTKQASGSATLTVWSSDDTDLVDVKQLKKNILELGKSRVCVDVGEELGKQLDLASASASTYASVATTVLAVLAVMLWGL